MSATHLHLSVPHFHTHSPHVEWHQVERPVRVALATAAALLTIGVGVGIAREIPALIETSAPAAALARVELPREWRYQPRTVEYEHMYGRHARAPSVEHMYARPRPQRF